MSFSYSQESIEELKNKLNIVDVIGRDVKLKRAGSNFKGLCPFHNEKTPSFVVSESKQYFTCFGCGARGDVIEFMRRYHNLDFVEAVEKLAEENGITLEKKGYDDKRSKRFYEINKMAARYFYKELTKGKNPGYDYITGRGITDQTIAKFGLGYADGDWGSLRGYLKSKGVTDKELVEAGLASQSKGRTYDKFRNRVIFPIINTSGKVIGFGGRAISSEDSPKYLNSPENVVFKKKDNLYSLNLAREHAVKSGKIILVEGYMDVISLYQSGIGYVVASLGTALTPEQARLLHRYTSDVILSYDADSAGRKAANRGLDILRNEKCRVRVLHVTDGKDPDEYVKKYGKDAFLDLTETAKPFGEYKLESAKQGFDLSKDEDKVRYIEAVKPVFAAMEPVERELYAKKLSEELGVSASSILRETGEAPAEENRRAERREAEDDGASRGLLSREAYLIKIVFEDPDALDRIKENKGIIQSPVARRVMNLAYLERKKNGKIDRNRVIDSLSDPDRDALTAALGQIIVKEGSIRDTLDEIIKTWKIDDLTEKEKAIIKSLSLAEGMPGEKVEEFQNELIEVRKEIAKLN